MLGRHLLLVLVALFVSSCGSSSPTTPSSSPPVSGAWIGHSTLTSVSGGECVGSTLAAAVGSRDIFSARIQQNESELAASLTYQGNRTSCVDPREHGERGPEPQLHLVPGWTDRDVCLFERRRPSARDRRHSGVRPEQRDDGDGHRYDDLERVRGWKQFASQRAHRLVRVQMECPRHPSQRLPYLRRVDSSRIRRWSHHHPGGYDPVLHEVRVVLTRSPAFGPRSSVSIGLKVVDCASAARRDDTARRSTLAAVEPRAATDDQRVTANHETSHTFDDHITPRL